MAETQNAYIFIVKIVIYWHGIPMEELSTL